jgi:hypothetical protein
VTLARDHAPAFNSPAPRRAVRAHGRGAARACATLPTTAFGAPCANVGARSASAPFVAGHRRAGQLTISGSVPRKRAPLLNALGSSLPAGQKRERERRPDRPRRALLHARGALCANAVHARVVLAERRRLRKRGGETRTAPEIALRGRCQMVRGRVSATPREWLRVRCCLQTRSRSSRRDGFSEFALS